MASDSPVPAAEAAAVTRYFTFGFDHVHAVGGFTYDKDVLVKITAPDPRAVMLSQFGKGWGFEYREPPEEKYWPRGMKDLSPRVAS